jgi:hypothetical protein
LKPLHGGDLSYNAGYAFGSPLMRDSTQAKVNFINQSFDATIEKPIKHTNSYPSQKIIKAPINQKLFHE